jgi:hypothetical protein
VSLGCAVENARLAAAAYGWRTEIRPNDAGVQPVLPAREGESRLVPLLSLALRARGEPTERSFLEAMRRRKVVRAEYDQCVKLPPALAQDLKAEVSLEHPGLTVHWITDLPTLRILGKFQELADTTVINRERFARELGQWLLPNDSTARVGMRGAEFGLSDEAAVRFCRGLSGQQRLLPDEIAAFAKAGNVGMRSSSAVAVITTAKDDQLHQIAAGRAYEWMALRLWQEGFVTAMHAGITEVQAPNMALRGRLRTINRPTVVFRVGRPLESSDLARAHSSRPALEDVLVKR